jgi:hypothetical protein
MHEEEKRPFFHFSNASFRVRLTSVAGNTSRDFSLDWAAVRMRYLP